MKQLIILHSGATIDSTGYSDSYAIEATEKIGFYPLNGERQTATTSKLTSNFSIGYIRKTSEEGIAYPFVFPEVDIKSLTVQKATYTAGTKCSYSFVIPTPVVGKYYTFLISKKGTVFNERNNWSFTTVAKNTTSSNIADEIVKQVNANSDNLEMTATAAGGTITFTAINYSPDYIVQGADELFGLKATSYTAGTKPLLDTAYIKDLASRCAAGKGFNYLGEDGKDIYPGYPEVVDSDKYVLYTLRFAVPRAASHQKDEVVYQLLHIAVPNDNTSVINSLDKILKITDISDLLEKS